MTSLINQQRTYHVLSTSLKNGNNDDMLMIVIFSEGADIVDVVDVVECSGHS
jgi:hypothetical protein